MDPDQSAQSMTVESLKIKKLEKFYNIVYTIYLYLYRIITNLISMSMRVLEIINDKRLKLEVYYQPL